MTPRLRNACTGGTGADGGHDVSGHDAALREGDELNVDPVAISLAHLQHRFEIGETDVVVDIDMAARSRAAVGDQRPNKRGRADFDREGHLMARDALGGDALAHAASLDMRQARRAPMRLVEMDVAVDERGQEELSAEIDALPRRCGAGRMGRDDQAVRDFNVREISVGQARVGQDHQMRFSRFAAAYL